MGIPSKITAAVARSMPRGLLFLSLSQSFFSHSGFRPIAFLCLEFEMMRMARVRVLWFFYVVDCDWIVYCHHIVSVVSKLEMGVGFGIF